MSTHVDVTSFLKRFGPNAGKSKLDRALEVVVDAVGAFTQGYMLSERTKAEVADRHQKFQLELAKIAQDNAKLAEDARQADNKLAVDSRFNEGRLSYWGNREQRLGQQGAEELQQKYREDQGRFDRMVYQESATDRRQQERLAAEAAQAAAGGGRAPSVSMERFTAGQGDDFAASIMKYIGPIFDEQGNLNEDNFNAYQQARLVGRKGIEAQTEFVRSLMGEREATQRKSMLPGLRQRTIDTLSKSPDVKKRIELLQQTYPGAPLSFRDIYGEDPVSVLGGAGEVPPLFMNPEAAQRQAAGQHVPPSQLVNPEPDLQLLREQLEAMNARTKRGTQRKPGAPDSTIYGR